MIRRTTTAATVALMLSTLLATVLSTASAADPVPTPPTDIELQDILTQLPGLIAGLAENRTDMLRCPELAGGTIGTFENASLPGRTGDEGNQFDAGDRSAAPRGLPAQVYLRTEQQTFNRRYQFAVARHTIWFKSNSGIKEPWAHLPVPACFEGKVESISVDDDELIAVDTDRWVYGMDAALRDPAYFNWSMRWGRPFWTGPGVKIPRGTQQWAWSVVSQLEDGTWRDSAGNDHAVGDGKVSHIWLRNHNGRRLTYIDPWLPPDQSYEMCSPHRGRFRSVGMSASGSTIFIIGRYGDLYTRLYDFDIAGADPLFFDYSYENQRGAAEPVIQLPSPGWVRHPKIRGTITDRISIHKVGARSIHRELRVEGRRAGYVGFWHKDITASRWQFTRTGGRLVGDLLRNPARDTSARRLAPSEDRRYAGSADGARITVPDFNTYCSPARVWVRLGTGERFSLRLHTTDNIRQVRRARGLDATPRMLNAVLEIPASVRRSTDPEVRAFAAGLGEGQFVTANLDATLSELRFRHQPWTLRFVR